MAEHDIEVMRVCVKAYLSHMRHINEDIREIELRINQIKERVDLMGIAYDRVVVSTSTQGDSIGEAVATLDELKQELADRIKSYQRLFEEARDMCQRHYVGRWSLWMHEVEGKKWSHIAKLIGYSESRTYDIAEGGLREIYDLMPEEYRRYSIPNAQPN